MTASAIVVGGGIAGLTVATLMARQGIAVTMLERAPQIREVGAGLQISPNGLAVLQDLGLEEQLIWSGAVRARAVVLADYQRAGEVARLNLERLKDRRYYFVHRADLVDLLLRSARSAGVVIELGREVTDIHPGTPPAVTLFGGETRRADLVACADGLHSVGRSALNGLAEPAFTGQVAWRAVVPIESFRPEARVTMAPGRHLVSYPLKDGTAMNLVAVQERAAWAREGWTQEDDPENLRRAFADFRGPTRPLLDAVDRVNLWGLFRHPVARLWAREGVALLGDAAHPTLPFLAQGANLALEDAFALSHTVAQGLPLERYQQLREARARRVIAAATGNAWKYHLAHGPMRTAAHMALRVGSRVAPGRMLGQFDWLYGYDVRRACAAA